MVTGTEQELVKRAMWLVTAPGRRGGGVVGGERGREIERETQCGSINRGSCVAQSVECPTLDFCSGHDPRGVGLNPV